ncbi:serine/threonine-protein phosphatase [Streptomyces asoensis]|uniref:Serine/threonine-protein phosphatase n=1 Tax=Streptomyces asoensis TaxID=249586 RepID=A0A6M4X463_9ACTN|nr:PP2C family protein-serine/threonine phosphatase [Streptomyces asoensis]QJT07029.1 serine/threonine-protein phosphatase [Streptomyces asoensis]
MRPGRRSAPGRHGPPGWGRSEGFGEELLGALLDQGHEVPPHLLGVLIAEAVGRLGGRETSVFLLDYGQVWLVPLPLAGLTAGDPQPIEDSDAGRAFQAVRRVEVPRADGVRVYLPLQDGGDQVGIMAVTLDRVVEDDRRLLRRIAALVADTLMAKHGYTDLFFRARRSEPMSVAAEIQWALLPPLAMSTPRISLAGVLEPAYDVAGDSFDYALNGDLLHVTMVDAMGHGLDAATMATVAIGAYRHARRISVGLAEIYAFMDRAVAEQFGPDHFVTAQMMRLDTATGRFQWVNAGHPAPLLIRGHRVVRRLRGPTTLPVGFGGREPLVSELDLDRGDRIMCFTDGLVEEHLAGGVEFGEEQLIRWVDRVERTAQQVPAVARSLSHALRLARGGITTDDASLLLLEWRGPG